MIEISGQYGSESADEKFWPFHRQLNDLFDKFAPNTYSKIIDDIAIIFRVSGEVQDFGTEGPERLLFRKKERYIVIDLTFPKRDWKKQRSATLRRDISAAVRAAFALLIDRLSHDDKTCRVDLLLADFEKAMQLFDAGTEF